MSLIRSFATLVSCLLLLFPLAAHACVASLEADYIEAAAKSCPSSAERLQLAERAYACASQLEQGGVAPKMIDRFNLLVAKRATTRTCLGWWDDDDTMLLMPMGASGLPIARGGTPMGYGRVTKRAIRDMREAENASWENYSALGLTELSLLEDELDVGVMNYFRASSYLFLAFNPRHRTDIGERGFGETSKILDVILNIDDAPEYFLLRAFALKTDLSEVVPALVRMPNISNNCRAYALALISAHSTSGFVHDESYYQAADAVKTRSALSEYQQDFCNLDVPWDEGESCGLPLVSSLACR